MTHNHLIRASLAAVSALALGAPAALAENPDKMLNNSAAYDQSYAQPSTVVAAENEIVIRAPYTVRRTVGREPGSLQDEEVVSVSRIVDARDLDLRYDASVDELNRRIAYTADIVCDEAEAHMRADSATTDRQCEREAMRDARMQARSLIERARG